MSIRVLFVDINLFVPCNLYYDDSRVNDIFLSLLSMYGGK